jgi:hypothetical protein
MLQLQEKRQNPSEVTGNSPKKILPTSKTSPATSFCLSRRSLPTVWPEPKRIYIKFLVSSKKKKIECLRNQRERYNSQFTKAEANL